ncbi:hypothetical protein GCM10010195_22820 [Kitasatospora griseola]|nr:hypothetical protein GCM10010195_22820 [Kitasatospora griseola]
MSEAPPRGSGAGSRDRPTSVHRTHEWSPSMSSVAQLSPATVGSLALRAGSGDSDNGFGWG